MTHLKNLSLFSLTFYLFFIFRLFFFLRSHLWHMEVPRLGVKSEPKLPPYTTATTVSETYTTAHSNASSLTHWERPGIKPESSWILVGFISIVPQRELPELFIISQERDACGLSPWGLFPPSGLEEFPQHDWCWSFSSHHKVLKWQHKDVLCSTT